MIYIILSAHTRCLQECGSSVWFCFACCCEGEHFHKKIFSIGGRHKAYKKCRSCFGIVPPPVGNSFWHYSLLARPDNYCMFSNFYIYAACLYFKNFILFGMNMFHRYGTSGCEREMKLQQLAACHRCGFGESQGFSGNRVYYNLVFDGQLFFAVCLLFNFMHRFINEDYPFICFHGFLHVIADISAWCGKFSKDSVH